MLDMKEQENTAERLRMNGQHDRKKYIAMWSYESHIKNIVRKIESKKVFKNHIYKVAIILRSRK